MLNRVYAVIGCNIVMKHQYAINCLFIVHIYFVFMHRSKDAAVSIHMLYAVSFHPGKGNSVHILIANNNISLCNNAVRPYFPVWI